MEPQHRDRRARHAAPQSLRIRRCFNRRPQIGMMRTIGCFTRAVERTVHAGRHKLNRKLFTHGRKKLFMPTEEAYGCDGARRSAKPVWPDGAGGQAWTL